MTQGLTTDRQARRNRAEERLDLQARMLGSVITLIETRVPWNEWPRDERSVLAGALRCDDKNNFEDAKARNLAWHLFRGDAPDFDVERVPELCDVEDRIRADLAGLVRLGSCRNISNSTPVSAPHRM